MKMTKRVLSLILSLAMLLTVATFPAMAEESAGYVYTPKVVDLKASEGVVTSYAYKMLQRPTNIFYVGDSLKIADNTAFTSTLLSSIKNKNADFVGFQLTYGIGRANNQSNTVYVGFDNTTGVLSGFYPTVADMIAGTNATTITFDKAGVYLFSNSYFYTSDGTQSTDPEQFTTQGGERFDQGNNPYIFGIDVQAAPTSEPQTAPVVWDGIDDYVTDITSSVTYGTVDGAVNQAYMVEYEEADTINTKPTSYQAYHQLKSNLITKTSSQTFSDSELTKAPIAGIRIDFETVTYLDSLKLSLARFDKMKYDILGSLDGENWYVIVNGDDVGMVTANPTAWAKRQYSLSVKGLAKHFRIDFRDINNDFWGITGASILELKGMLDAPLEKPWQYEGKEIKVSPSANYLINTTYGGSGILERPTNDVYLGDYLTLDKTAFSSYDYAANGELQHNSQKVVGFAFSGSRTYTAWAPYLGTNYYFALKLNEAGTGYEVEGFYATLDDLKNGTNKTSIELTEVGPWGFSVHHIITEDANGDYVINENVRLDNTTGWNKNYAWFLDVKTPPLSQEEISYTKPAQLNGLADVSAELNLADFATDPDADADAFAAATKKYYSPIVTRTDESSSTFYYINRSTVHSNSMRTWQPGFRVDFAEETYIKEISLTADAGKYLKYDVFGSLNETDWYPLQKDVVSSGSNTFSIKVDGIAKYFRVDVRATGITWGAYDEGLIINNIVGYENIPDAWTATFDHVTTEANEVEIADKAVTVKADGTVDVPAEFNNGAYSFYEDSEWANKIADINTYKVVGNKTIYVRLTPYEYNGKDVELEANVLTNQGCADWVSYKWLKQPTNLVFVNDRLVVTADAGAAVSYRDATVEWFKLEIQKPDLSRVSKWIKIDANGKYTGLYNNKGDTVTSEFKFDAAGTWAFGITAAYDTAGNSLTIGNWAGFDSISLNSAVVDESGAALDPVDILRPTNGVATIFFLDVRTAPESAAEVNPVAPEGPYGIEDTAAEGTITTPSSENIYFIEQDIVRANGDSADAATRPVKSIVTTNFPLSGLEMPKTAWSNALNATVHYVGQTTNTKAFTYSDLYMNLGGRYYVTSFDYTENMGGGEVTYDVFGRVAGGDWYKLNDESITYASNAKTTIPVNAVVEEIKVDFRGYTMHWGRHYGATVSNIKGVALPAAGTWTVTFEADGLAEPLTALVKADGSFEIPAELAEGYKFYTDAAHTKVLNLDVPVKADMTVYAVADVYTYQPKTYYLEDNKFLTNKEMSNYVNGAFKAPEVTLYAGDKLALSPEFLADYTHKVAASGDVAEYFAPVTGAQIYLYKYGAQVDDDTTTTVDTSKRLEILYNPTNGTSKVATLEEGTYLAILPTLYYEDNTGAIKSAGLEPDVRTFVIDVKAAPTEEPAAVVAPEYTKKDTDETVALTVTGADVVWAHTKGGSNNNWYVNQPNNVTSFLDAIFTANSAAGCFAAGIKSVKFTLDDKQYVESVSVKVGSIAGMKEADVYASLDGDNWFLVGDDVTPTISSNVHTFAVNAPAKFVELRYPEFELSGWWPEFSAASAKGVVIADETDIEETPAPSWSAEDGTKAEIEVNEDGTVDLPVAYNKGSTNYAITGWKMTTADGVVDVALVDLQNLTLDQIGNLVAVTVEVPVAATELNKAVTGYGDDAGKFTTVNYTNGFYIQGTQIRLPNAAASTDLAKMSGLRFINIINQEMVDTLKKEADLGSVEYGTLVLASTKYTGGDLVFGYNDKVKVSVAEKTWKAASDFDMNYFKYTTCVVGIPEANYADAVIVRPYIKYAVDGVETVLYGEQYAVSIYRASLAALEDPTLTDVEREFVQSVVDVVK